jgi:hypothetical protein
MSFNRSWLEANAFGGFAAVRSLIEGTARFPWEPGVYVVLRESTEPPRFLEQSPCGHFKGRDPTVSVDVLEGRWIEGCDAIYIGQSSNLAERWRARLAFAAGRPVGAWGGRYMWQIEDAQDLVVAYRTCSTGERLTLEGELLKQFRDDWGRLPFANLRG